LTALNKKELVGSDFCDLHKVSDCVNYDILLSKPEHYGIKGVANDVIKSYLLDRFQRVLVVPDSVKYYSKWESVRVGVPQGSILGPLLFLLYVNDLPNAINTVLEKLNRWLSSDLLLPNPENPICYNF
jgi:hypothetical protein